MTVLHGFRRIQGSKNFVLGNQSRAQLYFELRKWFFWYMNSKSKYFSFSAEEERRGRGPECCHELKNLNNCLEIASRWTLIQLGQWLLMQQILLRGWGSTTKVFYMKSISTKPLLVLALEDACIHILNHFLYHFIFLIACVWTLYNIAISKL